MQKMKKLLIGALLVVLMACVATTIYATVYQTRQVTNTVFIQGVWDFQVYTSTDRAAVWSTEDWGTMARSTNQDLSHNVYAVNNGDDPIYIKWSASVPTGFTMTVKQGADGTLPAAWTNWAQNTYIGPFSKTAANHYAIGMLFKLAASSDAPAGTSSITVTFTGSDTNS